MTNASLAVGTKAPNFQAKDQNNQPISLNNFRGKKICLYFYPRDNTPGCTAQACSLRDEYTRLKQEGWVIIGVSTDKIASHKKFETKYNLPFSLVADEDKTIVKSYGVWGGKKIMGKTYMGTVRTTFLIDEKGSIVKIIAKPNTHKHADEIAL